MMEARLREETSLAEVIQEDDFRPILERNLRNFAATGTFFLDCDRAVLDTSPAWRSVDTRLNTKIRRRPMLRRSPTKRQQRTRSEALRHIDKERLIAAPDCGLGLLGRERTLAKLKNLRAAADCF